MTVNYIKPLEMKSQITTSNQALKADNKQYKIIKTQASKLSKDEKLKGKGWNALKKIYRNYAVAAGLMIQANNYTIEANNKLQLTMGTETLIRPQILETIKQLEETIRREEEFLERSSHYKHMSSGLRAMRRQARETINYSRKLISMLKGKLARMKEIERNTRSLYNKASKYYDKADKRVKKIQDKWNGTSTQLMVAKKTLDTSVASIRMETMEQSVLQMVMDLRQAIEENNKELSYDLEMLDRSVADIVSEWQINDGKNGILYDFRSSGISKGEEAELIRDDEYAALAYVMISVDDTSVLDEVMAMCGLVNEDAEELRASLEDLIPSKFFRILQKIIQFKEGLFSIQPMLIRPENEEHIENALSGRVTLDNSATQEQTVEQPETKTEGIRVELL